MSRCSTGNSISGNEFAGEFTLRDGNISLGDHEDAGEKEKKALCCQRISPSLLGKTSTLLLLYIVQGIPFGYQSTTFPLLLNENDVSKTQIGFYSLLSLPWFLKPLWAPFVDAYPSTRRFSTFFWKRFIWIVPFQILLSLSLILCAVISSSIDETNRALSIIAGFIFFMNFFAATMDVPVDGLAVDILLFEELPIGNVAQVVGYKIGSLIGGGFTLVLTKANYGLGFYIHTIIVLFCTIGALSIVQFYLKRIMLTKVPPRQTLVTDESLIGEEPKLKEVLRRLIRAIFQRSEVWPILSILFYKAGETIGDRMFKLFIQDIYGTVDVAFWNGLYGDIWSILGSILGGKLCSMFTSSISLFYLSIFSIFSQTLRYCVVSFSSWHAVSISGNPAAMVIFTITVENLSGGALTTAMFSFMMARVNSTIGATHFTALAILEVAGKGIFSMFSGLIVDKFGFSAAFAGNIALSIWYLFIALMVVRLGNSNTPLNPFKKLFVFMRRCCDRPPHESGHIS